MNEATKVVDTKMVDLTAMMPVEQYDLKILAPGGIDETGWTITLCGPGHPKAVAWNNEQARKSSRLKAQMEAAQVNNRKYKPEEKDPGEQRLDNVKWIVSRMINWTPIKIGDETITFSEEAATKLFLNPNMGWVFQQIVDALTDERTFTKASAKT